MALIAARKFGRHVAAMFQVSAMAIMHIGALVWRLITDVYQGALIYPGRG